MIVTCPGCAAKYRVRNEAVPSAGARMRCPKCETLFLAKPPAGEDASPGPSTVNPPSPPGHRGPALPPVQVASSKPTGQFSAAQLGNIAPLLRSNTRPPGPGDFNPFGTGAMPPAPPMAPSLDDSFPPNTPRTTVDPFGNLVQPERPAPPPPGNDLFADMLGVAPQTPTGRTPNIAPVRTYEPPAPPMSLELASRPNMAAPRDLPRETAPRPTQVLPASSPVSRNNSKGPSLVQEVASWGLLGASCLVVVSGLAFAGWASEAVDLDPLLMPRFEETFSVRPPRSFVQRDDLSIDRLLEQVTQAQVRGDLAAEALGWRAVLTRNPQHPAAKSGMKTVLTKLGEPIPKELQ